MATDRRFGPINKFGTSSKFGASSGIDGDIRWVVEVDWDNDGAFDGSNEAFWLKDAETFIGRRRMFRQDGLGLEPMEPGWATIVLDNSSRRYDTMYTSSPLYPNVKPGRLARVRIYYPTTGNFSDEVYGVVRDIQTSGVGADATATLFIEDRQAKVNGMMMPMQVLSASTPATAAAEVVGDVGYGTLTEYGSSSARAVELFYGTGEESYGAFLHGVASDFLSYFWFDGAGTACWRHRGYTGSSQRDFAEADLLKEIYFGQAWHNQRNLLHLKSKPLRGLSTSQVVYSSQMGAFEIAAGQTKRFFIRHYYNNVPVVTDYINFFNGYSLAPTFTANASIDGTGTDLTANFTMDDYENLGIGGVFVFTNGGGATGWVFLEVETAVLVEDPEVDIYYPEDPTTVSERRELFLNSKWYQYDYNAAELRDDVQDAFDADQLFPVIQLEANPAKQFFNSSGGTLRLFGEVTLTSTYYGLSSQVFLVAGKGHKTVNGPLYVRTTLWLEPRM